MAVGPAQILDMVLTVVLIALAGVGIYGVFALVATLRSARTLFDDLDGSVPELVRDASLTVQTVNLELMRVDDILNQLQEVSDSVGETTHAAREAMHIPLAKLAEYGERLRRTVASMRESKV
jgi:hypothetical protein